mmetsp:Transcript_110999/g.277904  ORF Transcript_110999/g.277904 Transcript_110999/m.277904 type:complete len:324 (+) Transcript_110999:38-1009(+)
MCAPWLFGSSSRSLTATLSVASVFGSCSAAIASLVVTRATKIKRRSEETMSINKSAGALRSFTPSTMAVVSKPMSCKAAFGSMAHSATAAKAFISCTVTTGRAPLTFLCWLPLFWSPPTAPPFAGFFCARCFIRFSMSTCMLRNRPSTCGLSKATPCAVFASISAFDMPSARSADPSPSSSLLPASSSLTSPSTFRRLRCSRRTSRYCRRSFFMLLRSAMPPWQSLKTRSVMIGTTAPTLRSPDTTIALTAGPAGIRNSNGRAFGHKSVKHGNKAGSLAQPCTNKTTEETCTAPLVVASLSIKNSNVPAAGRNAFTISGTYSR